MKILYIDIDTLRPDHLGCYGYHRNTSPNIDEIAKMEHSLPTVTFQMPHAYPREHHFLLDALVYIVVLLATEGLLQI